MNTQQNIIDIFSVLHDGVIVSSTGNNDKLTLKVDCSYLAELFDKEFEYFFIELIDIKKIEFYAWMNPVNLEQQIFDDPIDIFNAELEILSADRAGENVLIACNQHDLKYDYCGGNLTLNCTDIKVYDQNKKYLTVEKFCEISQQYWNKFGQSED